MAKHKKKAEMMQRKSRQMIGMTPQLKSEADELYKKMRTQARDTLLFLHDVGAIVCKVASNPAQYGDDAVEHLADALKTQPDTLRNYQKIHLGFSKERLQEIAKRAIDTGVPITQTHLLMLLTVMDEQQRLMYLERIFDEQWSANDLKRELSAVQGPKNKPGAGRHYKRPTSPNAGYKQMASQSKSMVKRFGAVWGGVFEEVDQVPPDTIDAEMRDRATETRKNLVALKLVIDEALPKLDRNIARCDQVIALREAPKTPVDDLDANPFVTDDEYEEE
jgi:hypothetical protein